MSCLDDHRSCWHHSLIPFFLLIIVRTLSYAGIATHYIQSSRLEFVENQLLKASGMDVMSIADLLEDFSDDSSTPFSLQKHREVIDRCFSKGSVEEIVEALKAEVWNSYLSFSTHTQFGIQTQNYLSPLQNSPWANEIITALSKASPTSLKVVTILVTFSDFLVV